MKEEAVEEDLKLFCWTTNSDLKEAVVGANISFLNSIMIIKSKVILTIKSKPVIVTKISVMMSLHLTVKETMITLKKREAANCRATDTETFAILLRKMEI